MNDYGKNKICKKLFRAGLVSALVFAAIISTNTGKVRAQILGEGVELIGAVGYNARTIALGGCIGAITSDVDTVFLNPAGIGRFRNQELNISYNRWTRGMSYESVGYIMPLNSMTLGVSALYQNPYDYSFSLDDALSSRNLAVAVSAGKKLDENIMLGVNVKGMQEEISNSVQNSVVVDMAGLYNIGIAGVTVGFGIQNIGSKIKLYELGGELPINFNLGGTYSALEDTLFLGLDLNLMEQGYLINSGFEYIPFKFISLRMGYRTLLFAGNGIGGFNRFSAGFGIKLFKLHLDYAYVISDFSERDHIFSLRFKVMMEPFGKSSVYDEFSKLGKVRSKNGSCVTINGVTMCLYND
jgi:hypothetical protein